MEEDTVECETGIGAGEGPGEEKGDCEEGQATAIGEELADRECTERAGEGTSRLMTAGLLLPASVLRLGPDPVLCTPGTSDADLTVTSSSSSELSSVRSMTSPFLFPASTMTDIFQHSFNRTRH